ncbi:hypothetical protein ACGE0T_10990 [Parabacteroides sp. APC149_11_2_Y6]
MESTSLSQVAGQQVTLFIPDTESIGKLETMESKFTLTTKYRSADDWAALKDKPVRCYYMGLKDVPNDQGEAITCGIFVSPKEIFLSGQKVLVDAVRALPEQTPLLIVYKGKKTNKSTEGSTMIFDVVMLG